MSAAGWGTSQTTMVRVITFIVPREGRARESGSRNFTQREGEVKREIKRDREGQRGRERGRGREREEERGREAESEKPSCHGQHGLRGVPAWDATDSVRNMFLERGIPCIYPFVHVSDSSPFPIITPAILPQPAQIKKC